jgi:hypothetical protein
MDRHHAILASGEKLECDVLVVAAGCKYNLNPAFLTGLELGESHIRILCRVERDTLHAMSSEQWQCTILPFTALRTSYKFF